MNVREIFLSAMCFCLIVLATAAPLQAQPTPIPKVPNVVATVNDEKLTREELGDLAINLLGTEVLERLIQFEVLEQEARKRNITVTQEEVDTARAERAETQFDNVINQLGLADSDDLDAQIQLRFGMSLEKFRESLEARTSPFLWYELIGRKLIRQDITITDKDVRDEFNARFGPKVRVRQVVLASREDADDTLKKLQMGADFDKVAREISIDRITRGRGGEMPPLPVDGDVGKAVAGLKPFEISDVIEIGGRFHIFQLLENVEGTDADFEKEKDALREDLITARIQRDGPDWMQQLIQDAKIERFM